MHRVSPNQYQAAQIACAGLRAKGFERIGLALSPVINHRVEGKWLGGFLAEQQLWPDSQRLPPLLAAENERQVFETWLTQQRPDVVLIAEPHVAEWLPKPVGPNASRPRIAWLLLETNVKQAWHIDYHSERIGAAAVELVISQIHRNERGSPAIAHTLLLDCSWVG